MNKYELCRLYAQYLQEEGYRPQIDEYGEFVEFRYEGKLYYILIDEADEQFFRLVFPNVWAIRNEEEMERVISAALNATVNTKVAKIMPYRGNVWAVVELFCSPPDRFEAVFDRCLSALQAVVRLFKEEMEQ
ncbi:MAG: hypothetical protein WC291_08835 [Thermodesulfovibrionales bacterium]